MTNLTIKEIAEQTIKIIEGAPGTEPVNYQRLRESVLETAARAGMDAEQAERQWNAWRSAHSAVHELKADSLVFGDVWDGRKLCEVRKDDRGYLVGDTVRLRETTSLRKIYTGREIRARISHIQRGYGLPEGIVVLSLMEMDLLFDPKAHGTKV